MLFGRIVSSDWSWAWWKYLLAAITCYASISYPYSSKEALSMLAGTDPDKVRNSSMSWKCWEEIEATNVVFSRFSAQSGWREGKKVELKPPISWIQVTKRTMGRLMISNWRTCKKIGLNKRQRTRKLQIFFSICSHLIIHFHLLFTKKESFNASILHYQVIIITIWSFIENHHLQSKNIFHMLLSTSPHIQKKDMIFLFVGRNGVNWVGGKMRKMRDFLVCKSESEMEGKLWWNRIVVESCKRRKENRWINKFQFVPY